MFEPDWSFPSGDHFELYKKIINDSSTVADEEVDDNDEAM